MTGNGFSDWQQNRKLKQDMMRRSFNRERDMWRWRNKKKVKYYVRYCASIAYRPQLDISSPENRWRLYRVSRMMELGATKEAVGH